MVRLFVPEGEGQHPLVIRPPGAIPAQHDLFASPWRSSIAAAATTGGLALVGRSRPGIFLKSVALISAVDLTWTASGVYGRHELNRGIFKMDNVQPQPGKLWERTKHWTVEDATLSGGALGIFMALNPRALPGAHGFARFFGAATVGCALGSVVGRVVLVRMSAPLVQLLDQAMTGTRQKEYQRLQNDDKAKASLSRVGKLALWYHTSSVMRILRSPLQVGGIGGMGGMSDGPQVGHGGSPRPGSDSLAALKAEIGRQTLVQIEFKEGELAGPDVEDGYRAYKDNLKSRDANTIHDWLEKVQDLKKKTDAELQYVWPHLAQREHEFYQHVEEDREKDIFRRELQLLNNIVCDLVTRYAILGYHEHDAQKQLQQIVQADSNSAGLDVVSQDITSSYKTPQHPIEDVQTDFHGPTSVTEMIRKNWSRQRELLSHMESTISRGSAMQPEEGTHVAVHVQHLQQEAEHVRKNIEATERLLRWFEERVREADEVVKDDGRQTGA